MKSFLRAGISYSSPWDGLGWRERARRFLRPLAMVGGLLGGHYQAQAQFPINEPFTGTSTSKFTLGGNGTSSATLTGTATTPGYLRLTTNAGNQAGFAILNGSFPAPSGFNISFEFFSYGGTGADGISVFLIDANGTDPTVSGQFGIGAYGGSLGYAQKTAAGGGGADINGVTKGYLGIGIDEYGNYSTSSEGRVGGYSASGSNTTTLIPQSVALRGPIGTSRLDGYPFLTGSGSLPFTLSVPTTEAQAGSADYRKAYINVVPVSGSSAYQITVRIQHGTTVTTTINSFTVKAPPANLRVGFAASTGGANNYHEIRNLAILQNPFAGDDAAITKYNTPITFSLVSNDRGIGAALNYNSVDLDPATAGRQTTFTVAGQGTFTLNDNTSDGTKSTVTFTPVTGFAGVVTIPYVISDIVPQLSDPATITVRVTGADVATSVSGPASATAGSQVTYTVSTTNLGTETATNISPTLQLPTGLTVPTSPNYTYNSTSGLVTFSATTLAAGGAVSNSVSFMVPANVAAGTVATITSGYSYPTNAVVPDPVSANNTTSVTTTINGAATIVNTCVTPGKDGPGTLTASTPAPNTYYPGTSMGKAGNVTTITVGTAVGSPALAAGDMVLVMQMQGATMNTTASSADYGTVSSSTAGQYEYAEVASISGSTITLTALLTNTYTTSTSLPIQNFQVVRVPQYSSLSVTGTATGTAWSSTTKTGGVLALDVVGATTFTNGTGLSMSGKGFYGGGGKLYAGTTALNTPTVYATSVSTTAHGSKGEGVAGTPRYAYNGAVVDNGAEGYATGDNNTGAPANGGGGAQDFTPLTNTGNSGGGGGANLTAGGIGGYGYLSNSTGNQAAGGRAFGGSATRLIMGGGGGAGSVAAGTAASSSGGMGGGIIILRTGSIAGTATIQANGGVAPSTAAAATTQGGGGGGGGGTVLVLATTTGGLANITASALGGAGGSVNRTTATSYGPGGGGAGGAVYANSTLAAANIAAGLAGATNSTATAFGATAGTAGSSSTNTAATATKTIGGSSACFPILSVALSTATSNIARSSNTNTPSPAAYTATVSNVGGSAASTGVTITLDPQFTYASTTSVVLSMNDGTTQTLVAGTDYVAPTAGAASPVFSGLVVPSGATLRLNFKTNIAATSVNGFAYQASAAATYADPTRTAAATTATPGGTLTDGSAVGGTNYAAASSTNEDVTLVSPLPVELTRFEVLAVRQDALLTWATASEHDNDHFTVERSLTGTGYVAIGTVRGQGTSTSPTDYSFTDAGAARLGARTLYYRLKQVDLDGTASYSPVRAVSFAAGVPAAASLYPNPSQGQLVLDLSSLAAGTYSVQVLDLAGRVLRTQQLPAQANPLDLSGLPQGAYLVLVQGPGTRQTFPLLRD